MSNGKKRPVKDIESIEDQKYDLRKKAEVAVKLAREKVKGKRMIPHPTMKKTWIYV